MQPQVAFYCCALQLPVPGSQTSCDCKRDGQRGSQQIVIGDRCENRLLAPSRQYLEDNARDKKRDWKMNDDRMLSVSREERGLHIERVRGRRKQQVHNTLKTDSSTAIAQYYFLTTIVPVILG